MSVVKANIMLQSIETMQKQKILNLAVSCLVVSCPHLHVAQHSWGKSCLLVVPYLQCSHHVPHGYFILALLVPERHKTFKFGKYVQP